MILFWRGWGLLVLFVPLAWLVAVLLGIVVSDWHEPDALKAMATIYRLGAAGLAAATVTLGLLARHRSRTVPAGTDAFLFVPMIYWVYLVGLCVLVLLVISFFPIVP
jgi:hypothetical protein